MAVRPAPPASFDTRALIKDLGGYEAIEARYAAAGNTSISRRGMNKWGQRDSISVEALANLVAVHAAAGIPIDVYRYIKADGVSLTDALFA